MKKSSFPVYLAGDLVFRPNALALFERLKGLCAEEGLEGIAPFDGQADARALPPGRETILAFVRADRTLMDDCAGALICIDPFRRSADMDPGTAVEIGYLLGIGKPMEGYTTDGRSYREKVGAYWRDAWNGNLSLRPSCDAPSSGAEEDPDGMLVHSDGLMQNGMIEGFIGFSGGTVAVDNNFEIAFHHAARRLARRLQETPLA